MLSTAMSIAAFFTVTAVLTVARARLPAPPVVSGAMPRVTPLVHEPGEVALATKESAGVESWMFQLAAVDGSTRTTQAAGPPFSKKPKTDSATKPRPWAAPKRRTKSDQPVTRVGVSRGPLRVVPRTAMTLVDAAAIGCGPDGTSSTYTPGD